MIEPLLPDEVAVVETFGDLPEATLFPEEEAALGDPVDKRRREFTTGRACARRALERIGVPPGPIACGDRGEPRWPDGIVGSITHCDGYRAAAVAPAARMTTLGVDAEPHKPLPAGLLGDIALPEEIAALQALSRVDPAVHWDRLLFSAKEAVYKSWFPLTGRWLGFEDAVVGFDLANRAFSARLLVPGPIVAGEPSTGFDGRWLVGEGLVLTAIAVGAAAMSGSG